MPHFSMQVSVNGIQANGDFNVDDEADAVSEFTDYLQSYHPSLFEGMRQKGNAVRFRINGDLVEFVGVNRKEGRILYRHIEEETDGE